ncbi:hypothetical protein Vadar_019912 [Vaccinium darrowii]|uniref:Uncharacterized protein n=1 Tax=Vaccinium darrowii TaxID=229202 RepID=A0ACB7X2J9_9ERIC|nr:hypothetical protein Vadar_019912 [Vaccinium darrowii]
MESELFLEDLTESEEPFSDLCLFGKILAQRHLNKQGVSNILNLAWKTKESFTISPWKDNLYLFRFKSSSDKETILRKGPWSVMNNLLVLKEFQKGSTVEEMDFSLCPFWIQVHGLPISCLTKSNAIKIGKQFADFLEVDGMEENGGLILSRSFLRIRVLVDTAKPLLRGFFHKRTNEGAARTTDSVWINFKYERLSDFCFQCGRLGHEKGSCKLPPVVPTGGPSYGHELKTASLRDLKPTISTPGERDIKDSPTEHRFSQNEMISESEVENTAARFSAVERVGLDCVTPNLVVCSDAEARDGVRDTRGKRIEEGNEGIISTWDHALFPPSKGGVSNPTPLDKRELGLSNNINPYPPQTQQKSHSSEPIYYVTEPPESPKGVSALSRPNPFAISPDSLSQSFSPTSSPRTTKQNAMVDIVLAHVFEDLNLKRKATDVAIEEEKRAKLQKALRQQIWIPIATAVESDDRGCQLPIISAEEGVSQISGRRRVQLKKACSIKESPTNQTTLAHRPWVVFLMETKNNSNKLESIRKRLQFSNSWYVEPQGLSGGLALWWTSEGGRGVISNRMETFNNFMSGSGLIDMEFKGINYTWTNRREGDDSIREIIDKALANTSWRLKHPCAQVFHEPIYGSDHAPLVLNCCVPLKKVKRVFKFESTWTTSPNCQGVISNSWASSVNSSNMFVWCKKLKFCRKALKIWSKEEFGNNKIRLNKLKNLLYDLQLASPTSDNMKAQQLVIKDMEEVYAREEMYLHQRSRVNWLNYGDRNSSFFHATMVQRRQRNQILRLKAEDGAWCTNEDEINGCIAEYFSNLFRDQGSRDMVSRPQI